VPILVYGLPLLVYCAIAVPLGIRQREMMNADAMCYIRRAVYLLHGQFYYFISEHWSLMISWLMAPLIAARVDGLYAARTVTVIIGGLYLFFFSVLSGRLLGVHWIWRALAGVAIAPFLATVAVRVITPDQLLALWLLLYFLVVLDPNLPQKRGRQFLAGVVGGMAYLAKAFALPFVIVHLLMTLVLHTIRLKHQAGAQGENLSRGGIFKQVATAYGLGLVGFFLVASWWIAAMSWKYGHVTIGSSGAAAHGVTGRRLAEAQSPGAAIKARFTPPVGPYLSPMETPEQLFPRWSPFASKQHFKYQLYVIREHAGWLRDYLGSLAAGYVALIGMVVALLLLAIRSAQRWKLVWLLLTLGLFLGPFLLVVFQNRYVNPHVVPLLLLLCLVVALEWRPARMDSAAQAGEAHVPRWRAAAGVLVLGAFAWGTYVWMQPLLNHRASDTYRKLGMKLRNEKLEGPFACDSRSRSVLIAYHSGHKYVGFPPTDDPERAEQMLRNVGVRYVIIWDTLRAFERQDCAPEMVARPGWRLAFRFRGASVYQYAASTEAGSSKATSRPATTGPTSRPSQAVEEDMFEGFEDDPASFMEPAPMRQKPARPRKRVR